MKRREFIAGFGGAAAWPLAARGQQLERLRLVGYLIGSTADDPHDFLGGRSRRQPVSLVAVFAFSTTPPNA
jgi:hypothetical protein